MPIYYNEIDPLCCAWLRILIAAGLLPPGDVDERSIEEISPSELDSYSQCHFFAGIGVWPYALQQAGWGDQEVWTGSCPCQPFSCQGQHGKTADQRHLWPAWYRLIGECSPNTLFGEQVAEKDGLAWLDIVSSDLERQGYAFGACCTNAASFGAPHIRQRLYFTGRLGNSNSGGQVELQERPRWQIGNTSKGNERMANTAAQRLEGPKFQRQIGIIKQSGNSGLGCAAGGNKKKASKRRNTKGFWTDCEWLSSKDGTKERPIEPGSFSLAYGAPEGVGLVRGFGNALCAQQAIGFVEAAMECV